MVFCTHLSYTADRKRGGQSESEKESKKNKVFIDCKVGTVLPRRDFHRLNLT